MLLPTLTSHHTHLTPQSSPHPLLATPMSLSPHHTPLPEYCQFVIVFEVLGIVRVQPVRAGALHVVAMATSHIRVGVELELQELRKGEDERVGRHDSVRSRLMFELERHGERKKRQHHS